MSCVAVKVTNKEIQFAADSIATIEYTKVNTPNNGFRKLEKINGIIIGSVGLASECGLMYQFMETHKPEANTISSIRQFFTEFGEWKQKTTLNASATVTTKYFTVPTANVWQQIHSTSVSAGLFYVRARASFSYARPLAIALIGYDGNGKQYSRNDNVSKDYGGILIDGNSMSWLETSAIIKTSGATTIYVYVAYASATNDDSTLEFELQKLA